MKCACGASLTSVLAVLGVVGLGAAGYNTIRTGCPLGTCAAPSPGEAVVTPAGSAAVVGADDAMMSDESGMSCCEHKARGEKQECCPDEEPVPQLAKPAADAQGDSSTPVNPAPNS